MKCCREPKENYQKILSSSRKKPSKSQKNIVSLGYQEACSCPLIIETDRSIFPIQNEKIKSLDIFRDSLYHIDIEEKVYTVSISLDSTTDTSFPIVDGGIKVLRGRKYSVHSIINTPPTFILDFSVDLNGSSGAGPIQISTINDLSLEVAINIFGKTSIYSIVRATTLEIAPQNVTLGDGPMTVYIRAYFQLPPIPLVFHSVIPSGSVLKPTVVLRVFGSIYYSTNSNITATYNGDINPRFEGYTQPSYIEIRSL